MAAGKARLVDYLAVDLEADAAREENLQPQPPIENFARILTRFRNAFLASPRGIVMQTLQCECGFEASARDEESIVAEVQRHAREAHGMALSHDEALLLAFRAELDEQAHVGVPREPSDPSDDEKEEE